MLRLAEPGEAYYYNYNNKYACSALTSFHPYISLLTGLRLKKVSLRIVIFSRVLISCQIVLPYTMCVLLVVHFTLSLGIFTKSTGRRVTSTNHVMPNTFP